jgi:hypothetical protein
MAHRVPLKHKELLCMATRQEKHNGCWVIILRTYASDGYARRKITRYPGAFTTGWKRLERWARPDQVKDATVAAHVLFDIQQTLEDNGYELLRPGANKSS